MQIKLLYRQSNIDPILPSFPFVVQTTSISSHEVTLMKSLMTRERRIHTWVPRSRYNEGSSKGEFKGAAVWHNTRHALGITSEFVTARSEVLRS